VRSTSPQTFPFRPAFPDLMEVFVTVGTTKFEQLIQALDQDATITALASKGYRKITVQRGTGVNTLSNALWQKMNFEVEVWASKPSIQEELSRATLIISHAGAGTILEVLGKQKPLIVVINESLLGNHQIELAERLARMGCCAAATCATLTSTIDGFDPHTLRTIPPADPTAFPRFLEEATRTLFR